jgi:hypothetical protein
MKRVMTIAIVAVALGACSPGSSPSVSAGPTLAGASPTTASTAAPSAGATSSVEPSAVAEGTLTPAAPDPGVSQVATWWLDPASLPIDATATRLKGFVLETACASGQSPEGRILAPDVDYGAEALTITFSIAPRSGAQDCQGNRPFGVIFELEDAVDGRPILDGGTVPARDATTLPSP